MERLEAMSNVGMTIDDRTEPARGAFTKDEQCRGRAGGEVSFGGSFVAAEARAVVK
jgi:hypothetical protein